MSEGSSDDSLSGQLKCQRGDAETEKPRPSRAMRFFRAICTAEWVTALATIGLAIFAGFAWTESIAGTKAMRDQVIESSRALIVPISADGAVTQNSANTMQATARVVLHNIGRGPGKLDAYIVRSTFARGVRASPDFSQEILGESDLAVSGPSLCDGTDKQSAIFMLPMIDGQFSEGVNQATLEADPTSPWAEHAPLETGAPKNYFATVWRLQGCVKYTTMSTKKFVRFCFWKLGRGTWGDIGEGVIWDDKFSRCRSGNDGN